MLFAAVKGILQIHRELTKLWPWLGWHPFLTEPSRVSLCLGSGFIDIII